VDLRWHRADEQDALLAHVTALFGPDARVGRLCPRCGSSVHGRPWARARGLDLAVSLSRSGDHVVTAVSTGPGVGVDVERIAEVAARWAPEVVLAPGESADTAQQQARTWVAKEAVLKAYGVGLARPMTDLRLADFDGHLTELDAPVGHLAMVAQLKDAQLR